MRYQQRFGAQFVASGPAWSLDAKGAAELTRVPDGVAARCVNDEERLARRFEMSCDASFWREAGVEAGFESVPLHGYVHLFHLEWHRNLWVHVQHLTEYRYQPELRDKLVLPDHHRDLIDILTSHMDVLVPDFVAGKSGGTTILWDNDLEHNAIVAEFLRTLEYFNGLLFMTTNRIGEVDDAILSRCIATIHYETPGKVDARRLWRLQAAQFGAELGDGLVEALLRAYPKTSGRDIKELLKLATRYARAREVPLNEDVFRLCGQFRGLN
nr:hypothetical protein [Cupriavidus sp. L7L]